MCGGILVTGANGFVGSFVCQHLHEAGYEVVAVVRQTNRAHHFENLGIKNVVVENSTEKNAWINALNGVETVIHLAGRAHIMQDDHPNPLEAFREVNVEVSKVLIHAAAETEVKRFIYASSVKVHDADTREEPLEPHEELNPVDPYGRSKFEAENYLRDYCLGANISCALVRLPLVFGPGVKGNMLRLLNWVNKGFPLPLGAIHNERSLISLDNLASFFERCATHSDPTGVWMIEEEKPFSTVQMIEMMGRGLGKKPRLIKIPVVALKALGVLAGKGAEIERLTGSLKVNMSMTSEVFDWQPTVSSEKTFRQMAEWFLRQGA